MNNEIDKAVLDKILECNSCTDIQSDAVPYDYGWTDAQKLRKLQEVLPGIGYIRSQLLNYMFSNGITTGSINSDKILDDFLYRNNSFESTNLNVIRECIGWAAVEGECGMRLYENNFYLYRTGTYGVIHGKEDGVEYVAGYVISRDNKFLPFDIDDEEVENIFDRDDIIILSKDEFCNVRNNVSYLHGHSPLLSDKLRIDLLVSAYKRLNYDIDYDGPGRIILRPRDGFVRGEDNDVSTGEVLDSSNLSVQKKINRAKAEAARVAQEIKQSSSDAVIVLSNGFDDHIEHLERVTKATEFFDWLSNEGVILSQALGLAPSLLELGKVSGNVSMEKIIDNSMLNNIVPLREHYAVQFSPFLSAVIGVEKVYFNKYELQQSEDEVETMGKLVSQMSNLAGQLKTLSEAGSSEDFGIKSLLSSYVNLLNGHLYDENNDLRQLSVSKSKKNNVLSKIKALIGGT